MKSTTKARREAADRVPAWKVEACKILARAVGRFDMERTRRLLSYAVALEETGKKDDLVRLRAVVAETVSRDVELLDVDGLLLLAVAAARVRCRQPSFEMVPGSELVH